MIQLYGDGTQNEIFTVQSYYNWLDYGGIPDNEYQSAWKANIPLKVKIFLCLVQRKKLLTKDNLIKKELAR